MGRLFCAPMLRMSRYNLCFIYPLDTLFLPMSRGDYNFRFRFSFFFFRDVRY